MKESTGHVDEVNGDDGTAGLNDHLKKNWCAEIAAYKIIVTGGHDEAWLALMRMGRPLWWSTITTQDGLTESRATEVLNLAANKLMLGVPPDVDTYNEATMFGVASMLCRLGVRIHPKSMLASRAAADLMAILAYVNYEKDAYISSYASDPVLALGAIKVWYELADGLAKYILPEFKKLLLGGDIDQGDAGGMTACVLLLLAMDKCAMKGKPFSEIVMKYEFVPVLDFLKVVEGEEIKIFCKGMVRANDEKIAFITWRSRWKDWYMGFTHFVQLQLERNEDTLWYLLGRRAAGIFPRNQNGADLLIPIFWRTPRVAVADDSEMKTNSKEGMTEEIVSLMLVKVETRSTNEFEMAKSVLSQLCSRFVFGEQDNKPRRTH
ncbi:unnamed protein product [Phytophthora lilii]|uniref:Unnamed protein product n=1 Tax=Phytophthora lilii TaxID=2077276 RepID=A0A9W6U2E6_9STRA|nr:unnamed protein product [Phytophthora lilii]